MIQLSVSRLLLRARVRGVVINGRCLTLPWFKAILGILFCARDLELRVVSNTYALRVTTRAGSVTGWFSKQDAASHFSMTRP